MVTQKLPNLLPVVRFHQSPYVCVKGIKFLNHKNNSSPKTVVNVKIPLTQAEQTIGTLSGLAPEHNKQLVELDWLFFIGSNTKHEVTG